MYAFVHLACQVYWLLDKSYCHSTIQSEQFRPMMVALSLFSLQQTTEGGVCVLDVKDDTLIFTHPISVTKYHETPIYERNSWFHQSFDPYATFQQYDPPLGHFINVKLDCNTIMQDFI